MDKYSGYVMVVYVVTLALLLGYLAWIALRLKRVQAEDLPLEEQR